MYYILKSKVFDIQGKTVQAKIMFRPQINHFWNGSKPLNEPIPIIPFLVPDLLNYPDHFFTGTQFDLFSERLVSLFREFECELELHPVGLINENTNMEIPQIYYNIRVLDVLDWSDPPKLDHLNKTAS